MHICLISETWPPGINGVAHTLNHLADQLHDRGIAPQLVRPRPRRAQHQERHVGMQAELLVYGLELPIYREVRLGLPAPRRLQRLWRDQRPDIVYRRGDQRAAVIRVDDSLGSSSSHMTMITLGTQHDGRMPNS